ncbi:FAD/NAD(P)-binding oxidoreductase [Synechococcus sp. CBW1004]|uniref:NAD(P)/FAD-dependent oxidoreductase n=1 Tax=Synechococcus sp. CBW1004 TaxID=1353136 RepID=UPI0018CD2DB7|nr:FAD/NAD(P)-binding oxidoreductase [Synechococcus sp. CBW1004]QPN64130.1 NAD(P)/FAD-dependent oxidoreductase [Synechococcus sp. CBW1004]
METRHHRVLIVGGGAASITTASLLRRQRPQLDVAILEPSADHDYQPGWTLVGGGVMRIEQTRRSEASLIPGGVTWIQAAATGFDPDHNSVATSTGDTIRYDVLIVATGLQCRWEQIEGLREALGSHGVCSTYSRDFAPYTWQSIRDFKGGNAVFTMPATPVKCGGAPQKVMYMADDAFKARSGVGVNSRVIFCTPLRTLFAVSAYARTLQQVVRRRGIDVRFGWELKAVRGPEQKAVFDVHETDGNVHREELPFGMLHAVPPMSAPDVVASSPLAGEGPGGWVAADRFTTQHPRYANVFSLGDVAGLPTSKTAGAVRGEAPVTAANVLAFLEGRELSSHYDGYTVCPLITGYNNVVMAEFDYSQKPICSFLVDPTKERWSMWLMKTKMLPWLYWNRMIKGLPHESRYLKPLAPLVHLLRLDYREPPSQRRPAARQ